MVWVLIAIVSAIVEVSIPHFGMIFASVGAAAAAGTAALGFGLSPADCHLRHRAGRLARAAQTAADG